MAPETALKSSSLLSFYIFCQTTRATLTFVAIRCGLDISIYYLLVWSEALKAIIAYYYVWCEYGHISISTFRSASVSILPEYSLLLWTSCAFAFHPLLYFINNTLYVKGLQQAPELPYMMHTAKLLITSIFHHFLIQVQRSAIAWVSLLALCLAQIWSHLPQSLGPEGPIILVIGVVTATTSALASISTEKVLKHNESFWGTQMWLYIYGALVSCAIFLWDSRCSGHGQLTFGRNALGVLLTLAIILMTAVTEILVAVILKERDSLAELVGSSSVPVFLTISQGVLFPDLRQKAWNLRTTLLIITTAILVWTYHACQTRVPWRELSNADYKRVRGLQTTRSIVVTVFSVALLTLMFLSVQHILLLKSIDTERFFAAHKITPAVWGKTDNPSRCVESWVIREGVLPSTVALQDWEHSYLRSGCPVYPIPKGGLIFHQYWKGPWRAFNSISIEAFLATQRLADGHRMVYWYEGEGPPETIRRKYGDGEFGRYVEFRQLDRDRQARGSCVEAMPEWNNKTYREELGMKDPADIVSHLILHNYGGIWLSPDTILMRDLTPLIRSGPSAPAMMESNWYNSALVIGPPGTRTAKQLLHTTCHLAYNRTANMYQHGGVAVVPDRWTFSGGVLRVCELTDCGLNRHPKSLHAGADGLPRVHPCGQYVGRRDFPLSLRGVWTWRTRLDRYGDACVSRRNTLIGELRARLGELLDAGLDMQGRDLLQIKVLLGLRSSPTGLGHS